MIKSTLFDKHKNPRDDFIQFFAEQHHYYVDWDQSGTFSKQNILSVTRLLDKFFPHFDAEQVATKMMSGPNFHKNKKYKGMTKEEIKASWAKNGEESRNLGTAVHEFVETVLNEDECICPESDTKSEIEEKAPRCIEQFKAFLKILKEECLVPYRTEWFVYTDLFSKISGSIDAVLVNQVLMDIYQKYFPDTLIVDIYDWKCSREIKKFCREHGFGPCSKLPNTNFFHYAIQLNTYKYILENHYKDFPYKGKVYKNIKVANMFIVVFHETTCRYQRLKIPFYTKIIEEIMKIRIEDLKRIEAGEDSVFDSEKGYLQEHKKQQQAQIASMSIDPSVFDNI